MLQEVRLLGKGAFGAVLLAINRLDGRQYAVKCIREDAATAAAFSRVMREVATLSRLQHAHVVRYFQVPPCWSRERRCTPLRSFLRGDGSAPHFAGGCGGRVCQKPRQVYRYPGDAEGSHK